MDSLRPRSLTDYLRAVRRRRLVMIVATLVVAISAFIAIKRMPNLYESSTFIIVESPNADSPSDHSAASIDLPRRLTTIRQQVTSRTRLEGIIAKYGLYQDSIDRGARLDDVITGMRASIDVEVNSARADATDAFTISYRANDPEVAKNVTAEMADQLIAENVRAMQSQVSGEADVLRQRAAELSAQLHELEEKGPWLLSLKEDTPIVPIMPQGGGGGSRVAAAEAMRAQQMTIDSLRDQQYKIQQQLADVELRINSASALVEQQKKSTALRDNPTYAVLVGKRTELQGQRDTLINRQELTDKHPRVIAINDQIAAINRQIEELRRQDAGAASQTAEARELAMLQSERNRLKVELEVTGREITRRVANPPLIAATAPAVTAATVTPAQRDAGSARLAQDYLGLKQNYKEVVSRLQGAELKRQTIGSAKVEQFRVLDQANLPERPVSPNRRLLSVIAVAAGLVVGLGLAFAFEFRRLTSMSDAQDVEYYTRLPLLAAIPKTLTPAEQRRAEHYERMRFLIGTGLAALATVMLTKVLIVTNLFALLGKK